MFLTPCELQTISHTNINTTLKPMIAFRCDYVQVESVARSFLSVLVSYLTWEGQNPSKVVAWCPPGMETGMCMLCVTAVIHLQYPPLVWMHQQSTSMKTNWDNRTPPQASCYHSVLRWISTVIEKWYHNDVIQEFPTCDLTMETPFDVNFLFMIIFPICCHWIANFPAIWSTFKIYP